MPSYKSLVEDVNPFLYSYHILSSFIHLFDNKNKPWCAIYNTGYSAIQLNSVAWFVAALSGGHQHSNWQLQ